MIDLAERVILQNGGERLRVGGELRYRIRAEAPRCVLTLPSLADQTARMRRELQPDIERALRAGTPRERARAAYLAICLDLAPALMERHPTEWPQAVKALESQWNVVQALFYHADVPAGTKLREKAAAAGLERPAEKKRLW